MTTIAAIIAGFLIVFITVYVTWNVSKVINVLIAENAALKARLSGVESQIQASSQKRHSLRTTAGLEDANAILIDVLPKLVHCKERLDTAKQILGQVRSGPNAYDPERPSGRRPNGFED